jgi:hypothetical protein
MELTAAERDVFGASLGSFARLTGDGRRRALFGEVVRGIIGAERRCCSRIAACSPAAGGGQARRAAGAAHGPR